MEEISNINTLLSPKPALSSNFILHSLYTYSSRYIPMPEKQKQKSNELLNQPVISINDPYYQQMKQKVQLEYDQLTTFITELQQRFDAVKQHQYDWMGDKYRYYLRKFKKYSSQQEKLLNAYNNLQNIIIQSPPVQQQIKSINFIKMVSEQTNQKLLQLKTIVQKADLHKSENHKQIENLKKQLNLLKNQYFSKKRQEFAIDNQIEEKKKEIRLVQIQQNMKKIRIQKKQKLQDIKNSYCSKTSFSIQRCKKNFNTQTLQRCDQDNKNLDITLKELKNINQNNQKFIKTLSQTCENFKNRQLQEKKKINSKLVSQTDLQNFRLKSRQQGRYHRKSQQEQLLQNQQILKQLSLTNRMKDQFRRKTPEQILSILVKNKKLKDLMNIIEQMKEKELKQTVLKKRKINMLRSQMYKNETTIIGVNSFEESKSFCNDLRM